MTYYWSDERWQSMVWFMLNLCSIWFVKYWSINQTHWSNAMGDWQKSDWGLVTRSQVMGNWFEAEANGELEWRVGQKVTGDWSVSRGKSKEFLGLWRLVELTASARGANKWFEEAGRKENWTRLSSQKETEKIKMKRLCWLKWIRLNDVQAQIFCTCLFWQDLVKKESLNEVKM